MSDRSKNILAFAALIGIAAIASSRNAPAPAAGFTQVASSPAPLIQVSLIH